MLAAEDITSRFLNVISLFNKAIPLIAVQFRALDVGGVLTINATTVLDLARLGTDDEDDAGQATDRGYWVSREHAIVQFRIPRNDEASALISDSGADELAYDKRWGYYRLRMTTKDIDVHRELLLDLIRRASRTPPTDE